VISAHADRLLDDQRAALLLFEGIVPGQRQRRLQMPQADRRLHRPRQRVHGRAHFLADGGGPVVEPQLVLLRDGFDQRDALRQRRARIAGEGAVRGQHGALDIVGVAEQDAARYFLAGRIDDVPALAAVDGSDPLAVDIKLVISAHCGLLGCWYLGLICRVG